MLMSPKTVDVNDDASICLQTKKNGLILLLHYIIELIELTKPCRQQIPLFTTGLYYQAPIWIDVS